MKKVILFFLLFFSAFPFVFAVGGTPAGGGAAAPATPAPASPPAGSPSAPATPQPAAESEGAKSCTESTDPNNFCSPSFEVPVSTFSPGGTGLIGDTGKDTVKNVLETIIQKAMVAIGVAALFFMTIGAGYMIVGAGNDNLLNKGKAIFTGGLLALVIALSSYYLVNLVRFILYKT